MATIAQTLAFPRARSSTRVAWGAALAVAGSLLVAGLAQVSIRLSFTPVPITGQTLGVLLVGASLGPMLGGVSLLLYLAEGAIGLPFFAGGDHGASFLGFGAATGGYLWGFVLAAALVGWRSRRGWDRAVRSAGRAGLRG